MAKLEDASDEEQRPARMVCSTVEDLRVACKPLVDSLQLPQELLGHFMEDDKPQQALDIYYRHCMRVLGEVNSLLLRHAALLDSLEMSLPWSEIIMDMTRLLGDAPWSSPVLCEKIKAILSIFTSAQLSSAAQTILTHPLKSLFIPTQHPMLSSTTSRALQREAGGPSSHVDFHETSAQKFKTLQGWGCDHVLAWSCSLIDVERFIGLVLPPTLVMMDDWEPAWRVKGVGVLESWRERVDPITLKRMGVDKLLLKSMLQSLSLHSSTPLIPKVLKPTLQLIKSTTEPRSLARADLFADVIDKSLLTGWMYAPSGLEGRPALIAISNAVQVLSAELGQGIIRWLKTIIPSLLEPLRYPPTPSVLPHMQSNVTALLCVCRTIQGTGRISRWRGQVLDAVARLWAGLIQREMEGQGAWGSSQDAVGALKSDLILVVAELIIECPSIQSAELETLIQLDKATYQNLIPA